MFPAIHRFLTPAFNLFGHITLKRWLSFGVEHIDRTLEILGLDARHLTSRAPAAASDEHLLFAELGYQCREILGADRMVLTDDIPVERFFLLVGLDAVLGI
jgi:hypothetical protein